MPQHPESSVIMELACSVEAGLGLPGSDTGIVLTTQQGNEPNWLVASADEAAPEWPGTRRAGRALSQARVAPGQARRPSLPGSCQCARSDRWR